MRQPTGKRAGRQQRLGLVEIVCVVVVLVAVAVLVAWIVSHAGGGVLNQG